jgi:hypothetical protein
MHICTAGKNLFLPSVKQKIRVSRSLYTREQLQLVAVLLRSTLSITFACIGLRTEQHSQTFLARIHVEN